MNNNKKNLLKEQTIKKVINTSWGTLQKLLDKKFNVKIRPHNSDETFTCRTNKNGEVYVWSEPIVFRMRENPNNTNKLIFVVLSGCILFEKSKEKGNKPRIKKYNTNLEIYRIGSQDSSEQLVHVYGAHYDSDQTNANHPVFHAQITNEMDMCESIIEYFPSYLCPSQVNKIDIIQNVRIPTTQLDLFSIIVQLCADHLLENNLSSEHKQFFKEVQQHCGIFSPAKNNIGINNTNVLPVSLWYDKKNL